MTLPSENGFSPARLFESLPVSTDDTAAGAIPAPARQVDTGGSAGTSFERLTIQVLSELENDFAVDFGDEEEEEVSNQNGDFSTTTSPTATAAEENDDPLSFNDSNSD